jgi:eukaryotic-like serine/threonine-protein kinase
MDPFWPEGVPPIGELIAGRYQVEDVIGRGGMAVIVGARHVELGQRVAIKLLRVDTPQRAEVYARFLREARACAQMRSEHVVRVFDVGHLTSGQPFMVMEYLTGGDLGHLVQAGGSLPVEDAASYVLQACEAVAEAHAMGIVHRDLKPSNLFLAERADGSPVVKLLDFGISKVTAAQGLDLTATDATVGSPLFMSPEQIRGSKDVDHRTDIWSLGVVLYELLTGQSPFGAPSSLSALAVVIATETPIPVRTHRPEIPEALNAVILRCLEKLPEHRFQTVADLARTLAPFAPKDAARLVERIVRLSTKNSLTDTVSTRAAGQSTGRGRVLLVDDDPALLRAYARQLRQSGWTVDEAGEGREALARLGGTKFDVIVTDIDMPALSGVELLRILRARNDRTPVVLMTGGPSVGTAVTAVELGAFRYLLKPIDNDRLEEVVRLAAAMGKRERSSARPPPPSVASAAPAHGMSGVFGARGEIGLLELVQLLSSTGKTGVLKIVAEDKREIHFLEGEIVEARCAGDRGEAAFFALLGAVDGVFRFDPTAEPAVRVINGTSEGLLLEALRRQGESR